ncbi:hypothetical protein LOCUS_38400 [Klebsiella pneumoniae]|nr:hypothetical protein LOCUS_38400 [Klebsiella pneumoniae]
MFVVVVCLAEAEINRKSDPEGKQGGFRQAGSRWPGSFRNFWRADAGEQRARLSGRVFVRETVGVGSVSSPVAWLLSQGNLSGETLREQGVTITLGVTH